MSKRREKGLKERASFSFNKRILEILDEIEDLEEYRNRSDIVESSIKFFAKEKFDIDFKNQDNQKNLDNNKNKKEMKNA